MNLRQRMIPAWTLNAPLRRRVRPHLFWFWRDLWHVCDDFGRFEANAALLRAVLFSTILDRVSERDVEGYLRELHVVAGGVKLYTVRETGFGKVLGFEQPGLKSLKAEYPDLPGAPDLFAESDPPPRAPERKKEERTQSAPSAPAPADAGAKEAIFSPSSQAPEPFDANAELGNRTRAAVEQELFFSMCAAEGSDPAKLTSAGKNSITRAINSIRKANGGLTPDLIARAAAAYRKKYPSLDLTANALNKHWARLDTAHTPAAQLLEPEPLGWRNWINENTPDAVFARGGDREGAQWSDLDAGYRRYLIEKLAGRTAA